MKTIFFAMILLASSGLVAGEVRQLGVPSTETIKFGLSVDLPEISRKAAYDILNGATALISVGSPANLKIENVAIEGSKDGMNPDMDAIVIVTTRKQAEKLLEGLDKRYILAQSADAVTGVLGDGAQGRVVTFLFWEKLTLQDGSLTERPDALTRTAVALGHELLGNVAFLKRNLKSQIDYLKITHSASPELRQAQQEVVAFSAGISLIENVIEKTAKALPSKVISDFQEALTREKLALKGWQDRIKSLKNESTTSSNVVEINKAKVSCDVVIK